MKVYAIKNDNFSEVPAYLIYSKAGDKFYIELSENTDPWKTPLMLSTFAEKEITTIDPYHSKMWVRQRIIPTDRQNLGQILRDNGMRAYNEYELLLLGHGRCAQDDYYIEQIGSEDVPEGIRKRMTRRLRGAIQLGNGEYLVYFYDDSIKKYSAKAYTEDKKAANLFKIHPTETDNGRTLPEGYGLSWGEDICILYPDIYKDGIDMPLTYPELLNIIQNGLVNASQASEMLGCTRQYINELVKKGKLVPIRSSGKNTMFLKSDLFRI